MDVVYLALAGLFWLAIYALIRGCLALQGPGGRS